MKTYVYLCRQLTCLTLRKDNYEKVMYFCCCYKQHDGLRELFGGSDER